MRVFSENGKISPRQLCCLLTLDFFGKGALLLPALAEGLTSREFISCLLIVFLLVFAYGRLVERIGRDCGGNFKAYAEQKMGEKTVKIFLVFFFLYAFWNLVYLLNTFGSVGQAFILPGEKKGVLMIMVLAAGVCMAYGGAEVRARTAEVLYPLLFFPILLLMLLSAFHQQPGISEAGLVFGEYQEALGQLLKMFSVFGGLSFYVFLAPYVSGQEKGLARKGLWRAAAALAALFLLVAAAFGERGMALLPWPAVSFMSSARVPGGFLERWDVIFAGLLETMLLVSAGSSLFYLGLIGKLLFPKVGKKLLWGGLAVLVFLVALWCGENGKAAKIYVIWNSFVAVPVSVAFLVMVRCIGRKTERKGAVSCGKEQKSGQRKSGD